MNDVLSPSTRRQVLVLAAVTLFAAVVGLATWWQHQTLDRPTFAGELITAVGHYRSPNGTTILTLEQSSDGQTLSVRVAKHEGSPDYAASKWDIDGTKQWFFIFDKNDKLWGYAADIGPHSWQATPEANTFTNIGIHGGWAGTPKSFLQSLPDRPRQTYLQWLEDQSESRGKNTG